MQVYRGMDIGTAKPTVLERRGIAHHLIDVVEPEDEFSVAEFRALGRQAMLESDASALVITGGSGLHFRALVDPMSFAPTDPKVRMELESLSSKEVLKELVTADAGAGAHVDLENPRRVVRAVEILRLTGETPSVRAASDEAEKLRRYESEIEFTAAGLDPGDRLARRAALRVDEMRHGGLIEEVSRLAGRLGRTARGAVGYRELLPVIAGDGEVDKAFASIVSRTLRLARKQRTWFQRDPRIRWIAWHESVEDRVDRLIEVLDV